MEDNGLRIILFSPYEGMKRRVKKKRLVGLEPTYSRLEGEHMNPFLLQAHSTSCGARTHDYPMTRH